MRVIIAPDSYKGCLTAIEVAQAMEKGILRADSRIEVDKIPMADGGEGTVNTLLMALGGQTVRLKVHGPLGNKIDSFYGVTPDGNTALIEMAAASGLPLITLQQRAPLATTTYGTGELMRDALKRGCRNIIIGIGGSATNDGGMGMAQALGVVFRDKAGKELDMGCGALLARVHEIDTSRVMPELKEATVNVACDVNNPLCGEQGAAAVYGPQKGATPELVAELDENLRHFAGIVRAQLGKDILDVPGSGAAGGLGGGLLAFTNASLRPGIEIVVEFSNMAARMADADAVFTGEGQTDFQTIYGKVPAGIGRVAKPLGIPVICLSGSLRKGYDEVYDYGVTSVFSIINKPMTLPEAIRRAAELIEESAFSAMRMLLATIKA
nr:glycerate kinase [Maliibacterium massiliense]